MIARHRYLGLIEEKHVDQTRDSMPIYKFKCEECEITEEILCHHSLKSAFRCNKCEGKLVEVVTSPDFIVRGFRAKNNYE